MSGLALNGLILIVACVFMGWRLNSLILDRWFGGGAPTIYGSRRRLILARVMLWGGVVAGSAASFVVAAIFVPAISVVAVLFGLQAMMLDYCSRVSYVPTTTSHQHSRTRVSPPVV